MLCLSSINRGLFLHNRNHKSGSVVVYILLSVYLLLKNTAVNFQKIKGLVFLVDIYKLLVLGDNSRSTVGWEGI